MNKTINVLQQRVKRETVNKFDLDFAASMFFHYLNMYQYRYVTSKFEFQVTQEHVSYWRYHACMFGRRLINEQYLTREEFRLLIRFYHRPWNWEWVAKNMPLTVQERDAERPEG